MIIGSSQLSPEYLNHEVFKTIEDIRGFYDRIGYGCFLYVAQGTKGITNYTSYIYSSIEGTLDSISTLLKKGRIKDAYSLIRILYDDILVEIYYDVLRKEKFDVFENFYVEEANEWISSRRRTPSMKYLLKRLKESEFTKSLYPFFGWETYLKNNRDFLDDSVHANRFKLLLLNCNNVSIADRTKHLNNCHVLVKQLFRLHLSFIFHLNPHYLLDSTYVDCLEVGETPPEGSDTWIASYAQEAFDNYIKPFEDLAAFIKETCFLEIL